MSLTKYESNDIFGTNGGPYVVYYLYGSTSRLLAQTFTPSTKHQIARVKVSMSKTDYSDEQLPTGTIGLAIKNTVAGVPGNTTYVETTVDATTLPYYRQVGTPTQEQEESALINFDFSSFPELAADTLYAIVLSRSETDGRVKVSRSATKTWRDWWPEDLIAERKAGDDPGYANGQLLRSDDNGSSWEVWPVADGDTPDLYFSEWSRRPSFSAVRDYADSIEAYKLNEQTFVDYYDDVGWPEDWEAELDSWWEDWPYTPYFLSKDFPVVRPDSYDEDRIWDEGESEWSTDPDIIGNWGGYQTSLIVVAHQKIYFEAVS